MTNDLLISKILGLCISLVVVAINILLRISIIFMLKKFGPPTRSKETSAILEGIFIAQFINTALVILIVCANLSEHEPKEVTKIFNGPFYDFSPKWYTTVGTKVCITLTIETLIPYIRFFKILITRKFKILYDTRWTNDPYVTRKTSVIAYK